MRYAAGFTYDDCNLEMGEWLIERRQFDWLIESLEEYMPKRENSEVVWATAIDDEPHPEMDITQKVIQTLKKREEMK